jgi:hypothetical protein
MACDVSLAISDTSSLLSHLFVHSTNFCFRLIDITTFIGMVFSFPLDCTFYKLEGEIFFRHVELGVSQLTLLWFFPK